MADEKGTYYAKIETELRKWDEEIRKLKENTRNIGEDREVQYYEQIEDMMAMQELARQKLQELKESDEERWNDFKAGMDAAMNNLLQSHSQLVSRFA